jgi:hypothetical protein
MLSNNRVARDSQVAKGGDETGDGQLESLLFSRNIKMKMKEACSL